MKRKQLVLAAGASIVLFMFGVAITAENLISARIESRIESELPKANGVNAELSLFDLLTSLTSNSINTVRITVDSYVLEGSNSETSLSIKARNISKKLPTTIGSLEITATIPSAIILEKIEFQNAEIIGNSLQVSMGVGGVGQAQLVPRFAGNQIYFEIKSVSFLGSEIPASRLPETIREQVKSKSLRTLDLPKRLNIESVSISSKGLAIELVGGNIQLGKIGSTL